MPRKPIEITLQWRDENYGYVTAHSAFRTFIDTDISDTMHDKICRKFRRYGFEQNHSRAAWIAEREKPGYLTKLVADLESLGCVVTHEGSVPESLRHIEPPSTEEPTEDQAITPGM